MSKLRRLARSIRIVVGHRRRCIPEQLQRIQQPVWAVVSGARVAERSGVLVCELTHRVAQATVAKRPRCSELVPVHNHADQMIQSDSESLMSAAAPPKSALASRVGRWDTFEISKSAWVSRVVGPWGCMGVAEGGSRLGEGWGVTLDKLGGKRVKLGGKRVKLGGKAGAGGGAGVRLIQQNARKTNVFHTTTPPGPPPG